MVLSGKTAPRTVSVSMEESVKLMVHVCAQEDGPDQTAPNQVKRHLHGNLSIKPSIIFTKVQFHFKMDEARVDRFAKPKS